MIAFDRQTELVKQSFERLESEGGEWVSADEDLALDYMLHHPDYQKRRRVTDGIRSALRINRKGEPTKASSKYRHEVQIALMEMSSRGEVEFRFLDDNGQLPETPPEGPLHSKNRRYRLVPEETAVQAT